MKRLFDIVFAVALIVLLSPIMATLYFTVGIHKREVCGFTAFKFRTMKGEQLSTNLQKELKLKGKLINDPRITSIGSLLRKTSLDELPQLFNVLKGEMSFVGPKVLTKEEIDTYYPYNPFEYAKPGLTGLWQTSGRSDLGYRERVSLDLYYVHNQNFSLDLKILLQTPFVVLTTKGAY